MSNHQLHRIDKTKFAIVLVGALSASGYDEIVATTVMKKEAEAWLKFQVPSRVERRSFRIERIERESS